MKKEQTNNDVFAILNNLLDEADLTNVSAESSGYQELPDGYYLSEVISAKLGTSKKGDAMVTFEFKTVEDGLDATIEDDGSVKFKNLKKTSNKKFWIYYVLKDSSSIKRFVADMLKFEDNEGSSILEKDMFSTTDLLQDALEILEGKYIYAQVSTTANEDDTYSTWKNLISWKRAEKLELPR